MPEIRKCYHKIKLDGKLERTAQGFLRVKANFTRVGVLKYLGPKGEIIRELRHPDDVFDPNSYNGLNGAPMVNNHPDPNGKDKGKVDPANVKRLGIGWVGDEVQPKDIYLQGVVTVADAGAISDVESGKVELSCGYDAEIVPEEGLYNGEPYDVRQRNITYNHVALVKRGRAGENVRLLLDSDDVELEGSYDPLSQGDAMNKFKIGDKEYEVSPELHGALSDAFGKHDAKVKELQDKMAVMVPKEQAPQPTDGNNPQLKDAQEQLAKAQAKADAAQAELDELKKKRFDSADPSFQKAVAKRAHLETVARKVVKEPKFDGKSDLEIQKEVIQARYPTADLKDKSEAYIEVRFDTAAEAIMEDAKNLAKLGETIVKRADGEDVPDPTKARQKMIEDSKNAWKRKETH